MSMAKEQEIKSIRKLKTKSDNLPSEQSIRKWFDRHYATKGRRSMRVPRAYPVLLDHLEVTPGKSLLDIGCGPGWLLKAAAEKGLSTFGIDVSPQAVKLASEISPGSNVSAGSIEQLNFTDNSFDYVCCIGVLEHFLDIPKSIRQMQRVAKPDAKFCIMVPNTKTLYWQFAEKFSRQNRDSNENALSLKEWKQLFETNNFVVEKIERDDWQIKKTLSVLGLGSLKFLFRILRKIIWSIIPLKYGHQFVFIMKKRFTF